MRTEFIQTKIRPIKKLFIIESNDFSAFIKIFKEIISEVDSIQNLIFINEESLWNDVNREFIKRHDPDIILNLSQLDDFVLSNHFEIKSIKPIDDNSKIARFGTPLFLFTTEPFFLKRFKNEASYKVLASDSIGSSPLSLSIAINFGFHDTSEKSNLSMTIFKDAEFEFIKNTADFKQSIFSEKTKLTNLTTMIGGGSRSTGSIYEIEYNNENLFEKGKYIFIFPSSNLSALVYFWNTRATYSSSELAWVAEELLEDFISLIDKDTKLICFNENTKETLQRKFLKSEVIIPDRYYFYGSENRWRCFEHNQIININGNNIFIQHPFDKCFSDIGYAPPSILEIIGLQEFNYPIRENLGALYKKPLDDGLQEVFGRKIIKLSRRGLAIYNFQFHPHQTIDINESIILPKFPMVVEQLFNAIEYNIKTTTKTSILEQLVNLLGGISESHLICKKEIFDLINGLTPINRTDAAIKKLLSTKELTLRVDDLMSELSEIEEIGAIAFPSIIKTADELFSMANQSKKIIKNDFLSVLQLIYNKKILLRGKSFKCKYCSSNIWLSLDTIKRKNYCHDCDNEISIPVDINDAFRLNQLVARAVDQGQLSTLLLLHYFSTQGYKVFDYLTNIEVWKNEKLITDIDVFIRIGNKLGVAECKSNQGFSKKQIDELVDIALNLKCDFIVFSCLLEISAPEISEVKNYLSGKNLTIPSFIFTANELFSKSVKFHKYFEPRNNIKDIKGAVLVGNNC